MRVLVVEDEEKVLLALTKGLQGEGFEVRSASTGEEGFFLASSENFDVLLLDVMLPGRTGFEILRTLRKRGIQTPVLMLTAKDAIEDRVEGLDSGADDYLVKPFAFPELVARLKALLRRGRSEKAPTELAIEDLVVDPNLRRVTRNGRDLDLTVREYDLLVYLLRHQGELVPREMLARDVWREERRATPLDNVIDVHISRLRKKVDAPGEERLIHTVRGVGFIMRVGAP